MAEWFYRNAHCKELGPVSGAMLLELVREGDIQAGTEVRKDDSPWILACQVNGLWQAAGRPGVAFHCPYCNAVISKPPSRCEACDRDVVKAIGKLLNHAKPTTSDEAWKSPNVVHPPVTTDKPKAPPLIG